MMSCVDVKPGYLPCRLVSPAQEIDGLKVRGQLCDIDIAWCGHGLCASRFCRRMSVNDNLSTSGKDVDKSRWGVSAFWSPLGLSLSSSSLEIFNCVLSLSLSLSAAEAAGLQDSVSFGRHLGRRIIHLAHSAMPIASSIVHLRMRTQIIHYRGSFDALFAPIVNVTFCWFDVSPPHCRML